MVELECNGVTDDLEHLVNESLTRRSRTAEMVRRTRPDPWTFALVAALSLTACIDTLCIREGIQARNEATNADGLTRVVAFTTAHAFKDTGESTAARERRRLAGF